MAEAALILLLGLATYGTRLGGYWLAQRLRPSPFATAFLEAMPGAIFAALVAPMVLAAGPKGWLAAAIGFIAMRLSGHFLLALVLAMGTYLALVMTTGAAGP